MPPLDIALLCQEAEVFSRAERDHHEASLFGVTDGKAAGTYLEHKFGQYLRAEDYQFDAGNAANGIDFPGLDVDIKVTSIRQPQSSCPFRSARQKVYGLGYSLLVFVYDKIDDERARTANLRITDTIFVEAEYTADFQLTRGLLTILANEGNEDDLMAFMAEKNLPVDEIELSNLAREILQNHPRQGYLTISNALQWRLQYARVIERAGSVEGVRSVFRQHD